MLSDAKNSLNSLLRKSLALSVLSPLTCFPNCLLINRHRFLMLLEIADLALRRNTQLNLLQLSVHTRKYLFPSRSVVGDGPQTSQ